MKAIDVPELVKSLGFEELASMGREEMITDFLPACITGFADGDLYAMHEPYSGEQADLYGEGHYSEGRVAKVVLEAALANRMDPGPLYDFQGFVAEIFTDPKSLYATQTQATTNSVRIHPEAVVVDDNIVTLDQKPALVVDYGACLTGRSYLGDQMGFVQQNRRPFIYSPLTRLHFTNQVIMNTYDAVYGDGTAKLFVSNQLYIGREDGIKDATSAIIDGQRAHGAPTEVADIIVCAGSQHTSEEDLKPGIKNALILLREGGKLIIRSLAKPATSEMGTKIITEWALEAGFEESKIVSYQSAMLGLGPLLMSGHFGERAIEVAILTK